MNDADFQNLYQRLNNAQQAAVDTIEGPVLVVAGPGSGKTEILSLRVANVLKKTDTYASSVLCLTFTDSASVNMRKRLTEIIGNEAYHVGIHTFHNFCVDVIQRYPEYFYDGAFFEPADELVQREVLEEIFQKLDHDNPIQSTHPDHGFVYLDHAKNAIGYLKRGGLTPEEFDAVLEHNKSVLDTIRGKINTLFSKRVSTSLVEELEDFVDELAEVEASSMPVPHLRPFHEALAMSLGAAVTEAQEEDSTKPVTAWKQDYTRKEGEKRILKAEAYLPKLEALQSVYAKYTDIMYERGYYDFDDMLLDVIAAMEENPPLKSELQEQFQYILVDEFQDTNDAQMRLLLDLAETPHENDRPNVMAVGDDDQAIYKFQGAEISNVLNFKHRFEETEVITMTDNYRSTQEVLDTARSVITQGEKRLEHMIEDMNKDLSSANEEVAGGAVEDRVYPTATHQYHGIADSIRTLLDDDHDADEIAVIGRRHSDLKDLVPYLQEQEIPVTYERQQDVFEEQHIHQLIQMSRFVVSLMDKDMEEADEYLPEILSFPFWGINRQTVWNISVTADDTDSRWLAVMQDHEDEYIQQIANFFLACAQKAQYEPVEYVIDMLVGAHIGQSPADTESSDVLAPSAQEDVDFVSPFKEYYFSREAFEENKPEYLRFLSSLKTFIHAIREYRSGSMVNMEDLVRFVDTHKDNDLSVKDTSPFVNADKAVELLTAHKAKGREFETVYVLSAQQSIWAGRSYGSYLPLPFNLPFEPAGDTRDDQLRLLYVAMTRAKRHLYLNRYAYDQQGSEALPVQFIADIDIPTKEYESDDMPPVSALLETTVPGDHGPPFVEDEEALLEPLVEDYQLSVTHLNNFLDVTDGGPQAFLEQNLLRFPQPMPKAAMYGAVMHSTLKRIYMHLKDTGTRPPVSVVTDWFQKELEKQRLAPQDREHFLKRGVDALEVFYPRKKDGFKKDHLAEFNFRQEGVRVDDAHLAGKIDKLVPEEDEMIVHDFKTGKAESEWNDRVIKLWRYKNQLLFYKLLVENSKTFGGEYTVPAGVLEFVEPKDGSVVDLDLTIKQDDVEHMQELVSAVYQHIRNLSFPNIGEYEDSIDGIRAFEEDLINTDI